MSRKLAFVLLAGAASVAALAGSRLLNAPQPTGPSPAPAGAVRRSPAPGLPVSTYVVEPTRLEEKVLANGTLLADEEISLQSEISGKVAAVNFEEGGRVRQGDLLVKIEDADLQAQRQRALYRQELARVRFERQQTLLQQQGTSQEAYDVALNEWRILESEVDLIEADLAKTEIRAPFDGVIGLRYVSAGSYLSPATRIATLQKLDRLKLEFSIPERYIGRVPQGSRLNFTVAGMEQSFAAEVYAIEPKIDVTTRMILLRARVPEPDPVLLPGAFASLELTLREIEGALLIPTTAVQVGLAKKTVFILEEGRAVPRDVVTGIRLEKAIQILHGLSEGDVVITSGIQQLRPGMPVEQAPERAE